MMKVRNMVSNSSGREVANQFVISGDSKVIFQSYDSTICVIDHNKEGAEHITLGRHWDYSKTTSKYLYQFLREYAGMDANKKALEIAIRNKDIAYNANLV
jgi:hypothetical protein